MDHFEWNEAAIQRLPKLWMEGLSLREIGLALGVSKNAVIGKAYRLALPSRPSPIIDTAPGETPRRQVPQRFGVGATLPPLPSLMIPLPARVTQPGISSPPTPPPVHGSVGMGAGGVTACLDVSSQTSAGGRKPPAAFCGKRP
jgi:GcrA cell cycle regulator